MSDERASKQKSHVVRLKMPKQERGYTDLVYGTVGSGGGRGPQRAKKVLGQSCFDNPVLIKSDGFPTYHLANVVDDHYMKITHVIRAAEWMSSTPKHLVMYEAFGWEAPLYAHVGLLQNNERQKYSKRRGDADLDMRSLETKGVFPEALINYVALHGWSHDLGDDFLRMDDLVKNFDLKFTKGNTIIVPTKLGYFQRRYAEKYAEEGGPRFNDMVEKTLTVVKDTSENDNRILICSSAELRPRVTALLRLEARKYAFPRDFVDRVSYFFFSEIREEDYQEHVHWLVLEHLEEIKDCFANVYSGRWNVLSLNQTIEVLTDSLAQAEKANSADDNGLKKIMKSHLQSFLRWAVSYSHPGPTIAQTMEILGRNVTLERLGEAVASLENPIQKKGASAPP